MSLEFHKRQIQNNIATISEEVTEENFPKPMEYINPEPQEIEKTTSWINTKKTTYKHIKVKMLVVGEGVESSRGKDTLHLEGK